VRHPAKSVPPLRSGVARTVLASEFAERFRLDRIENRLGKLLGPIAKEVGP